MASNNKPLWSEGMFMRPQHLQQNDRYMERFVEERVAGLRAHGWGLSDLVIDSNMLGLGKISLTSVAAVMPDGTPVAAPMDSELPPPRDIDTAAAGATVLLALPARRGDELEIQLEENRTPARYQQAMESLRDTTRSGDSGVEVQIGRLRLTLRLSNEPADDFVTIPVARIREVDNANAILLDEGFLPPALGCQAHPGFLSFIGEVESLLRRRGESLAGLVDPGRADGLSSILDFLMLQTLNRAEPLFTHFAQLKTAHPETVYAAALQLAGELATYSDTRRPRQYPDYQHDKPDQCFPRILDIIRGTLSVVTERPAVQLPMEERKYGIHISKMTDTSLVSSARFVLTVRANVPSDQLIQKIPNQIKVGPVEEIRNLVTLQLPGIELNPQPVAPRAIPYYSGAAYFELNSKSDLWQKLAGSAAFAFHVAGEFPGLTFEFWAIRE
jgi:type VI secretion system protein ImpJ